MSPAWLSHVAHIIESCPSRCEGAFGGVWFGVATVSRLLEIIGLFCII